MWKVGDEIIFIQNGINDSHEVNGFILGKKYKIIAIEKTDDNDNYRDDNGYKYCIQKLFTYGITVWWIEPNSFKLYKKELNSEVDYLNAFQDNFKYGG